MTTVTLEHVTKRFKQHIEGVSRSITAVDDVSLKLISGDVLAVLGPSGCGKSTLLRLIAGLETPDEGTIYYDNVPLPEIDIKDRGVGMVFQNGALMPHWEGWRTVGFFLTLRQREQEVPARVAQVSKITGIGLEKLLERRPSHLSGGERQRVGIARALARDPRVFLFDEPFANLDAKIRAQARVELKRLLYEFPVTSVYVTHDQVEAVALAHRIAVMRAGRIEQVGTYHQLYHNPVNLFVATFIGTPIMNEFAGYVVDGYWQGENFGGYPIRHDLEPGTRITLGIRPENIRLVSEGVPAVVDHVTPFFAERYKLVEVHLAGERWQMTVPLDEHIEVGSTIHCDLNPDGIMFFDSKTEQRVG
ncbi:MAG TPA: ABC transporter ATP-binding protein [Spirillospora sp.]|nr:ABC transporter ATP-binding protein [Spirillospora sp.]